MKIDWSPLRAELGRWRADGRKLPFWWRDDDAVAPTAALDKLSELSHIAALPVHLAVIPKGATTALVEYVNDNAQLIALVHGLAHENHQIVGKKAEFGDARSIAKQLTDAKKGLSLLCGLFGAKLAHVFVPPWNRATPELLAALGPLGFSAVSTFGPRATESITGLLQINTHIDPIDWKDTRGLLPPEQIIAQIVQVLVARRTDEADAAEPLGYLTHHLVHNAEIWEFSRQLLSELNDGPIVPFRFESKG